MLRLAAVALATVILSACRVEARVDLAVAADGSGRVTVDVTLDRDAVAAVGDLAGLLRVADLEASGWKIEGPFEVGTSGAWQVRAAKDFSSEDEGEAVLAEVGAPFAGLDIERTRTFFTTHTEVRGVVDLTAGLDAFSDAELAAALGGLPFGVDQAALERHLGGPAADAVGVGLTIRLPGDDAATTVTPRLGELAAVEASSSRINRVNITFAIAAFLFAAALVASLRRRT